MRKVMRRLRRLLLRYRETANVHSRGRAVLCRRTTRKKSETKTAMADAPPKNISSNRIWQFATAIASAFAVGGGGATWMTRGDAQAALDRAVRTETRMVVNEENAKALESRIARIERALEKWDAWGDRLTRIESKVDALLINGGCGPVDQSGASTNRKAKP